MAYKFINNLVRLPALTVMRGFDAIAGTFAPQYGVRCNEEFQFHEILFQNREIFLAEYIKLAAQQEPLQVRNFYKTATQTHVKHDDNWKAVPLMLFNYMFLENILSCPETFRIISRLPGCCGIMFSVLGPGKHLPAHKGIYRGIYRCLFTLQADDTGECWLRVADKKYDFKTGTSILFDETIEHEAFNATTQPRIAIYIDFYRKLPFPLNLANATLYSILRKSPYVLSIHKEYKKLHPTQINTFKPTAEQLQ